MNWFDPRVMIALMILVGGSMIGYGLYTVVVGLSALRIPL